MKNAVGIGGAVRKVRYAFFRTGSIPPLGVIFVAPFSAFVIARAGREIRRRHRRTVPRPETHLSDIRERRFRTMIGMDQQMATTRPGERRASWARFRGRRFTGGIRRALRATASQHSPSGA